MCKAIGNCRVTVSYMATRTGDAALGQRIEGDRPGAPSLRLATPACSAQGGGLSGQLPALPGREARGSSPWRPQAGDRDPGGDDCADVAERPLVARRRLGSADGWPPLPHPDPGAATKRTDPGYTAIGRLRGLATP